MTTSLMTKRKSTNRTVGLMLTAFATATISMTSGCSWLFGERGYFRDQSMDYKQANVAESIEVITENPTRPIREQLVIPVAKGVQHYIPNSAKDVPRQRSAVKLSPNGEVTLLDQQGVDSLFVETAPHNVVPLVQSFWQEQAIDLQLLAGVSVGNKVAYLTDWFPDEEFDAHRGVMKSTIGAIKESFTWKNEWHRFLISINRAEANGHVVTQIITAHQSKRSRTKPGGSFRIDDAEKMEVVLSSKEWQRSGKEDAWLQSLNIAFAEYTYNQLYDRTAAVNKDKQKKVEHNLAKDGNGFPVLHISQEFAQAWVTVGRALKKSEIRVDDLNRSLAIYYINLETDKRFPLEEKGDAASSELEKDEDENLIGHYELKLSRTDGGVQLSLQKDDETLAPLSTSGALLRKIQSEIR